MSTTLAAAAVITSRQLLDVVVYVVVQSKRSGSRAARALQSPARSEIEPLLDEPVLRLTLDRVTIGLRPLGDEEHLPPVSHHQFVDAPDGTRLGG